MSESGETEHRVFLSRDIFMGGRGIGGQLEEKWGREQIVLREEKCKVGGGREGTNRGKDRYV